MQHSQKLIYTAVIFTLIGVVSTFMVLFAKGYTLSNQGGTVGLAKTGWILVKSAPDGAKVLLNNEPAAPTNNSIGNLKPGEYSIKIQKEGYHEWQKTVPVKEELVTMVNALLIKKAAEIKPITLSGVKNPQVDPTNSQIVYFSDGSGKPGLWVYSLSENLLSPSRTNPRLLAEGTDFKDIKSVDWSADQAQILVTVKYDAYGTKVEYLLNLDKTNLPPFRLAQNTDQLRVDWQKGRDLVRQSLVERLTIPEEYKALALEPSTLFAPDEKKFLYTKNGQGKVEYHIVNLESPLPVGKSLDTLAYQQPTSGSAKVLWHTTSEHLIIVEGNSISLMEMDGANRTTVFSSNLVDNLVLPTPGGRNIIINTTFTNGGTPNLHNIFFN